jgi:uncharacterized protein (DUF697 family)
MGLISKIKAVMASKLRGKDTSEAVAEVVGKGIVGVAVGELVEEGEKVLKKEIAKRKSRAKTTPKPPKG